MKMYYNTSSKNVAMTIENTTDMVSNMVMQ